MTYDYLIVGAGLFGAVFARTMRDAGKSVLVIERRDHIGGNCYDYRDPETGIMVNKYGGHIFHTNDERIWKYVNRFSSFKQYEHRVKANFRGRVYSFPPNRLTLEQLDVEPGPVADELIREMFFRGYSEKQWGRPLEQIPGSTIKRIPIRDNYDDRYFSDICQGLPDGGYTLLIQRILGGAPVQLYANYQTDPDYWRRKAQRIVYSGPLDELYGYDLGRMEYRSLRHETRVVPVNDYQGCATMNYTDAAVLFTRQMEWRHFGWTQSNKSCTIVTTEWPAEYADTGEPFYPVRDSDNAALHAQYADRAKADGYIFGGRLADYQYYDMHQVIARALHLAAGELTPHDLDTIRRDPGDHRRKESIIYAI